MARKTLDLMMAQLKDEILMLESMVELATEDAVEALLDRDALKARQIVRADARINDKRYAVENAILTLIATQSPMAHDLRLLAAMLEISAELERMGDYAKGIARVVILLEGQVVPIPAAEFRHMCELSREMLHRSMTAFMNEDVALAQRIPNEDEAVDECYNRIYRVIVASMMANPAMIDYGNWLMWAAHNLERLADRVTNLCERIVFTSTGELLELD